MEEASLHKNACLQKKSHYVNNLRLFGDMVVVTMKDKLQGKLKDFEALCAGLLDTHQVMLAMYTGC